MGLSQEMRSPKYTRYDLPCASCECGYVYKQINKNESKYSTDLHCTDYLRRVFNKRFVSYVSKTSCVNGICGIDLGYFLEQRWLFMCVYNLRTQKLWNPVLLCILDQIITYNIVSNFQWSYLKWCQEWD